MHLRVCWWLRRRGLVCQWGLGPGPGAWEEWGRLERLGTQRREVKPLPSVPRKPAFCGCPPGTQRHARGTEPPDCLARVWVRCRAGGVHWLRPGLLLADPRGFWAHRGRKEGVQTLGNEQEPGATQGSRPSGGVSRTVLALLLGSCHGGTLEGSFLPLCFWGCSRAPRGLSPLPLKPQVYLGHGRLSKCWR